ncbi:hypothetical protein B9Z55_020321 [Caenorhabditis nigoni]|nr:hypothetical protein B9Z55_020321 [Caenorhabditis nigoni]
MSNESLSSSAFPQAVYGNETYQNYTPKWDSWPIIVAAIPIFYMVPTLFVIVRIIHVYWKSLVSPKQVPINQHIFLVLSLAQVMSFLFFIADYMMLRLPATGFFTSYCATVYPNQYLKLIFFFTFYFNYSAMIFPFLLCLLRLILMIFPNTHQKINTPLLAICVPAALIYPICFTFFLIPAVGYCRQLSGPYPFGSVSIYYSGGAFGKCSKKFFQLDILIPRNSKKFADEELHIPPDKYSILDGSLSSCQHCVILQIEKCNHSSHTGNIKKFKKSKS